MDVQFVVTPWRDAGELLELRSQLYGQDRVERQRAVDKVRLAYHIMDIVMIRFIGDREADEG